MENVKCSVDRIEGELLVLVSDEGGATFHLSRTEYDFEVNDVVILTTEAGKILSAVASPLEKEERLKKNRDRLSALFAKRKK